MKRFLHRATIIRAHRSIALVSILLIMFTAITGFLLQHAKDFGWHQQNIAQGWILDAYDVKSASRVSYTIAGDHLSFATQLEHLWYVNASKLPIRDKSLVGAVSMPSMLVFASAYQLHLFTTDLVYVESINIALNSTIQNVGVNDGLLMLKTSEGWYQADESLLSFKPAQAIEGIMLSEQTALPQDVAGFLPERVTDLHYMRFMQDLHGGRLFGLPHWVIPDLTAFALLFLSLTGLMMKWKRSRILA